MVHLYTSSLIAVPNMLTRKWHTSVHLGELDSPLEQLTLIGQIQYRKYEVQNRNLGTNLRTFLHDIPKDWAFQVHMCAYAHNSHPFSDLNISPQDIVFHTRPRIPLTFDLNLNRNTSKQCISKYCSQLPQHSYYDKTDLNPFFFRNFSKPISHWFLAVETAMFQI